MDTLSSLLGSFGDAGAEGADVGAGVSAGIGTADVLRDTAAGVSSPSIATPSPSFADVATSAGRGVSEAAGGAGGGWGDTLAGIAKTAAPYLTAGAGLAQGGAAVMGALQSSKQADVMRQGQKLQMQGAREAREFARPAATAAMEASKPLTSFAATELEAARAGQVTPAQQAKVDEWKSQAKMRIQQYLAHAGISDSSMAQQWYDWIDRQALAMTSDMVAQNAQLGIGASGQAGSLLASVPGMAGSAGQAGEAARTAATEAARFRTNVSDAEKAMAQLAAMGA